MGVVLSPHAKFFGVPIADALRIVRRGRISGGFIPDGGSEDVICALVSAGLLSRGVGEEVLITPAGRGLVRAKIGDRMTLDEADRIVSGALSRLSSGEAARAIGATQVRVFGSVMRREPFPADVDLLIVSPTVDGDMTPVGFYDMIFDGDWRSFARDVRFSKGPKMWCDSALIWDRGVRIADPVIEPPDEGARAEAVRLFGLEPEVATPVPDDPEHVITGKDAVTEDNRKEGFSHAF